MQDALENERSAAARAASVASTATGHRVETRGLATIAPGLHAARFRLDNGLVILALPDRQAPIFAFQTWFRVGSRNEQPGKTGIAHLFEHLMFKGTKSHPTGEFDREMENRGAQTNAATWVDWTFYRESLPASDDNFELVLRYEADRMVNLHLDQALVDAEREVVKNERRQRVEDSIVGALDELTYRTAYRVHPYGHPTIGSMEDLASMTLPELERFYRTYYAPNNAIVVVCGDLELTRIVTEVTRAYGGLPAQDLPPQLSIGEPAQLEVRRALVKKPTDSERMAMVFHGPRQTEPEHAALQVAAEILCGGETGRIYDDLVIERELCQEVHASITPYSDPGLFQIDFALKPGRGSHDVEDRALAHLGALAATAPTLAEVDKSKNRIEAAFVRVLLDVDGKAEQMGHFEATTGDAGYVLTVLERLRQVSPEDVRNAVARYLEPNRRTVVCVQPEEPRAA